MSSSCLALCTNGSASTPSRDNLRELTSWNVSWSVPICYHRNPLHKPSLHTSKAQTAHKLLSYRSASQRVLQCHGQNVLSRQCENRKLDRRPALGRGLFHVTLTDIWQLESANSSMWAHLRFFYEARCKHSVSGAVLTFHKAYTYISAWQRICFTIKHNITQLRLTRHHMMQQSCTCIRWYCHTVLQPS